MKFCYTTIWNHIILPIYLVILVIQFIAMICVLVFFLIFSMLIDCSCELFYLKVVHTATRSILFSHDHWRWCWIHVFFMWKLHFKHHARMQSLMVFLLVCLHIRTLLVYEVILLNQLRLESEVKIKKYTHFRSLKGSVV